jgi:hypothetical protein
METYLRPIQLSITEEDLRVEISMPKPIYFKGTKKLADIHISPTLVLTTKKEGEEEHDLPIDIAMFSDDKFEKFNKLTYSIGKLIRLAELNLDRLHYFVTTYFYFNSLDDFFARNKKCKECSKYDTSNNFTELSFGELRNFFSGILKTETKFRNIDELKTPKERNNLSKVYDNYIYDRDCYTHGKLFFLYPDFRPVLRVKPPNKKEHFVELTEDILYDNLAMYDFIEQNLTLMLRVLEP